MRFELEIKDAGEAPIIETAIMRRAVKRTLTAVRSGGLVVWTGPARIGKTSTARWLSQSLNESFDPNTAASFRALHYEVGEIRENSGNQQKQGIRSLYTKVLGVSVPDSVYRRSPAEALAEQVYRALSRRNIRLVMIDEAGCLSLDAIRGMVLVRDIAESDGFGVSLTFIGMDDLPTKIDELPQIRGRIHAWCHFEEYDLNQTTELLRRAHPHFENLPIDSDDLNAEVSFLHEKLGGLPGVILPFLRQVDSWCDEIEEPMNLATLMAVHDFMVRDHTTAIAASRTRYSRRSPAGKQAGATGRGEMVVADNERLLKKSSSGV